MENTYRLEFNEQQQEFHLDDFTHEENTNGWFTIYGDCTEVQFKIYDTFVKSKKRKKYTKAFLIKCSLELDEFVQNLMEHKLAIEQH